MTDAVAAVTELAGYAEQYRHEVFDRVLEAIDLNRRGLPDADPRTALPVFVSLYCLDRTAGVRAEGRRRVASALDRADGDPDELWRTLGGESERADAVKEAIPREAVTDAVRLADREGNPFRWVREEVRDHGRVTTPYEELVAVRGVESDSVRAFLRDAVWLADAENCVRRPDKHRLQSMDGRLRAIAESLWPSLEGADRELLTKRVVDACADHGVSSVAFNQGAQYFCRSVADDAESVEAAVRRLGGQRC